MGANTSRVTKVLVTNTQGGNTGNSVSTIVAGDVLLLNRAFQELGDTATPTNNALADRIHVALGRGPGLAEFSMPIDPKHVRKVTRSPYEAPVQHKVTINDSALVLAANTDYSIKVSVREQHGVTPNNMPSSFFYYKSGATVPTSVEIFNALAAKINNTKRGATKYTAAVVGGDLEITGKAVAGNGINAYQYMYFDVALRSGFNAYASDAKTITPGRMGKGHADQVADMEQATKNVQRILWPIPLNDNIARHGSGIAYNLVTIEHYEVVVGDLQSPSSQPLTTVIAFASTGSAASAKETAFLEKLTSVLEGAGGTYVSDIIPA